GSLAVAKDVENDVIGVSFRHPESGGDGVRVLPELGRRLVLVPRPGDRRTACCLHGDHLRTLGADPAQILHLLERLPHADEADSTAGRIEDRIGQLPSKLLGDFVAHRLLSLDAEWLLETRDVEPALGLLALIHDLRAIADQSVDECDARAILLAFHTV